jgi:CHAD domain-containing protein
MAYRFKLKEPIGRAVQRIGQEQIERAQTSLDASDAVDGIHQTRKAIKRLRALLRLIRPGIEKAQYKRLNTLLGEAGRTLSATRDRDVLARTITGLAHSRDNGGRGAQKLAQTLASDGSAEHTTDAGAAREAARALLLEAGEAWQEIEPRPDSFETIAAGLERGMSDLAAAYADSAREDDEAIHDLRKAVQRHWRHMRLVEAAWPGYFAARAEEAEALSELLGRAQDLTLLIGRLEKSEPEKGKVAAELLRRAQKERKALRKLAQAHAVRLIAEGAASHARRAKDYWEAAVALRAASKAEGRTAREAATAAVAATEAVEEEMPDEMLAPQSKAPEKSPRVRSPAKKKRGAS